jgi:hypothetical protein
MKEWNAEIKQAHILVHPVKDWVQFISVPLVTPVNTNNLDQTCLK